jgi:hypothetical protein
MRKRGEPEGGPEKRKDQFEDSRGLGDSPELPLEPEEEDEPEKPDDPADRQEEEDTAGGKE